MIKRIAATTGLVLAAFASVTVMEQVERNGNPPFVVAEAHKDYTPWNPHPHCYFGIGSRHQHGRIFPYTDTIIAKRNGRVYWERRYYAGTRTPLSGRC